MGLLENLFSNKAELIEWQNTIMKDKSTKLRYNKKQLEAFTLQYVLDNMRIFDDSSNIINSTTKPDVFFSRLQLAEEKLENLVRVEPYLKHVKAITVTESLSALLNKMESEKDAYICNFLYRYYGAVEEKANGMKTEKGKENQFKKFKETLEPYVNLLTPRNKSIYEAMCDQKI